MNRVLLSYTFPVEPMPWERVSLYQGRLITSEKTRKYERTLKELSRYAMGPRLPFDQPICVDLTFMLTQPHRFRKRPLPDVKMDIDNLVKSTLDGLNEVVWTDDGRIVELRTKKIWSRGGAGCVVLWVFEKEIA